jgi:hypothetical protein
MTVVNKANPTEAEMHAEMASEFPDYFAQPDRGAFLDDCVRIAAFLSNTDRVRRELKVLEERLSVKVALGWKEAIAHYELRAHGKKSNLDQGLKHLLSNEMTGLEVQSGFNSFESVGSPAGRVQTYVGFIQPEQFRHQVRLGRHWKDPGVPLNHGEYTHRLQWYLLGTHIKDLTRQPVRLFMQIGEVVHAKGKGLGLWDALFDRDGGEATDNLFKTDYNVPDSRSPESFTRLVIDDKNAGEWPFLHWFIKARLQKRLGGMNNHPAAKEYVEKKLKKFGFDPARTEGIVGTWRTFLKGGGTRRIEPGNPITRTGAPQ